MRRTVCFTRSICCFSTRSTLFNKIKSLNASCCAISLMPPSEASSSKCCQHSRTQQQGNVSGREARPRVIQWVADNHTDNLREGGFKNAQELPTPCCNINRSRKRAAVWWPASCCGQSVAKVIALAAALNQQSLVSSRYHALQETCGTLNTAEVHEGHGVASAGVRPATGRVRWHTHSCTHLQDIARVHDTPAWHSQTSKDVISSPSQCGCSTNQWHLAQHVVLAQVQQVLCRQLWGRTLHA